MYNYYFRAEEMPQNVVFAVWGDVTGDRIPDRVYLTGVQTSDSPFVQNITLKVQDGSSGRITRIPLRENAGYNPRITLNDFTGNGASDILISIASGGSGGTMYHYIYSFLNNKARLIFDFDRYNEQYKYEVTYKEDYKVEVVSLENKERYVIDISNRDAQYLKEIYDEKGNLKSPIEGFVNPLSGLYPVDFEYDGVYDLLAYQRIAGRYNADALGYVLNTLKWRNGRFVLENQYVAINGTEK